MKVPHKKGVANHLGPESCGRRREAAPEALTGNSQAGHRAAKDDEPGADAVTTCGRQHQGDREREVILDRAWSENPSM
jgi:hypothetical protein